MPLTGIDPRVLPPMPLAIAGLAALS